MKKSKILIGLLISCLFITGCGPKTPEEALQKAFTETDKAESAKMDLDVTAEVKSGGMTISVNGKATMEIKVASEDEGSLHATMTMELGEESLNMDAYMVQEKGKAAIGYLGINDEWMKATLDDEESEDDPLDMDFKFKEVKKVSSENGITVYEATIAKEQIQEAVNKLMAMDKEMEDIDLSTFHYDFDDVVITFSVNKKHMITKFETNLPIHFSIDMQEERTEFTVTLKMVGELSKYNEVEDIKVPQEVIEKAIDAEELEAKQNIESYADEIGWDVWENEDKDNKQYTDTTLEYDGPAPTKVDVLVENGEVISGVIEIDGYVATYQNKEIVSFEKK